MTLSMEQIILKGIQTQKQHILEDQWMVMLMMV